MLTKDLKKIKFQLRYTKGVVSWRIVNLLITGLLLAGVIFAVNFIYQNINTALINTATIIDIKSNIKFDVLEIQTYEKINKRISNKQALESVPTNLRNVFTYGSSTLNYNQSASSTD